MVEAVELIPWGSTHPLGLVEQARARIKAALEDGVEEVHIVCCVVEKNGRGNYTYTVTCSEGIRPEVALMASHDIHRLVTNTDGV